MPCDCPAIIGSHRGNQHKSARSGATLSSLSMWTGTYYTSGTLPLAPCSMAVSVSSLGILCFPAGGKSDPTYATPYLQSLLILD